MKKPRPGLVIALTLAGCVLAYNAALKSTPLGPLAMGACPSLQVVSQPLLSLSLNPPNAETQK